MLFRNTVVCFILLSIDMVFAGPYFDSPSSYVSADPFFVDFSTHVAVVGSSDNDLLLEIWM